MENSVVQQLSLEWLKIWRNHLRYNCTCLLFSFVYGVWWGYNYNFVLFALSLTGARDWGRQTSCARQRKTCWSKQSPLMILLAAFRCSDHYVGPFAICIVSFCHVANLKLSTVYPMTGIKLNYHKSSINPPPPHLSNKPPELFSYCKFHINSLFDVCLMIFKVNSESSAVSITNLHVHNDKDPLISFYFMV